MSIYIRDADPESPLLVMYNIYTDELGISSEGWELVAVTNMVPFVRYINPDDYEEYEGGHLHNYSSLDTGSARRIGYAKHEGVVEKTSDWQVVGEL